VFVGGVVVGHHVQLDPGIGAGNLFEERQELGVGVPVVAGVGDPAGCDSQGREQGGGAAADVVVGLPFGDPRAKGQDRGGAVQGLDPALLVDADHDGLVRWGQVQSDRVTDLGVQARGRWRT
jgi:hypothetical protein